MKYLMLVLVLLSGCGGESRQEVKTVTVIETVIEYVEVQPLVISKISLSFDDGESVKYLYENRYLFIDRNITVTMFVSRFYKLSDYEKEMLIELEQLGFEIGIHSEFHHNMNKYVNDYGREQYIENEVLRPFNQLTELGLTVSAMAYPFGAYDGTINNMVNHKYNLRSRGFDSSNGVLFNQAGYTIIAQSIDRGGVTLEEAKLAIDQLTENGGAIYLTGHVINNEYSTRFYTPGEYLIELIDYAQSLGVEFCNFSEC